MSILKKGYKVLTDRFDEIRSLPLFSGISETSFSSLTRGAYVQNFPPHTELATEGESADFLHIVSCGTIELFSSWTDRESCMTLLGPNSTFILAATINDRPYLMSARTVKKTRVIMIPSEDVRSVFETDVNFSRNIVSELADCYRGSVKNMKNLKLRRSVERLANYIVKHAKLRNTTSSLTLDVEKKKLASFLGMTPENLSRAFASLKNHGVEVNGDTIFLHDNKKLVRFSKPNQLIDG
jgi:CRP/FNR family transcriptional regulator, transcriptional activator FtrB